MAATGPPTADPSRTALRAARGTKAAVAFLLVVVGVLAVCLWWIRAPIPPLDGRTPVPGLHAVVDVRFDGIGIPHIHATSDDDAWTAVGYLQARDRLWQ